MNLTERETAILQNMHWNKAEKVQKNAIQEAMNCKDISFLFQPINFSSAWENCAVAICSIDDDRLEKHLKEMFEWLQDINWPGALTIVKRLYHFNKKTVSSYYKEAVEKSLTSEYDGWTDYLSVFIKKKLFSSALNESQIKLLEHCYEDFGWLESDVEY